jgi:hypothetical protein
MLEKAKIIVQETRKEITVMYNPTELSMDTTVQVQGEGSNVQFQRVNQDDLTVSLFFDSYEQRTDIRVQTGKILALTKPTTGTAVRKEPPVVLFSWGNVWFTGIIVSLKQKFTLFLESGIPVRAELSVTFKQVLTETQDLEAQGYFNCRRLWQVKEHDRLYLIANQVFGSPNQWRLIADANNIYDPLNFPTTGDIGRTLVIIDTHATSGGFNNV